jgi:hypothetical protein
VVHGGSWHRRVHHINYVRWADDCIVTASARQVLEETVLPQINACFAARGVRLSPTKTVSTPIAQGFDFLGQTLRKYARPNGKPAKLQITPSRVSFQALTARIKALCKQAAGRPPAQLIDTLNPVLRGWANYHRHSICGQTFAHLDNFVWQWLYRWAKRHHPNKTGRWIVKRYFPHRAGEPWRFTDPVTGAQTAQLTCRVLHGALVMLERSAGKLARSVLRGPGGREPTWLPGGRSAILPQRTTADLAGCFL